MSRVFNDNEKVGFYRIVKLRGEGGMSEVYEVRHHLLNQVSALKVLRNGVSTDERFLREGQTMAALHHPNVVRVQDAFKQGDRLCLVMELMEHGDLEGLSDDRRRQHAMALFLGIVAGVRAAHAKNVVHRDLKPANVLIEWLDDGTPCPKVVDFGIAHVDDSPNKTQVNRAMGTPHFMAPEQHQDAGSVRGTADIWALGAILHWLYCGKPPFDHDDRHDLLTKKKKGLSQRPLEIPESIWSIILRCLEFEPEDRYPTCDALLGAFQDNPRSPPPDAPDPAMAVDFTREPDPEIEDLVSKSDPLRTYDVITSWMDPFLRFCRQTHSSPLKNPHFLVTRQRQALVLARAGATQAAQAILEELVSSGQDNPETLGILARTFKDRAYQARNESDRNWNLGEAYNLYCRGHDHASSAGDFKGSFYNGINVATCLYLTGRLEESRLKAESVFQLCENPPTAPYSEYWRLATMAEASFLIAMTTMASPRIDNFSLALRHLKAAAALKPGNLNDIASTGQQLRRILQEMRPSPLRIDLEDQTRRILSVPPVVAFVGRVEQVRKRDASPFVQALEQALQARPVIAYSSAASPLDFDFLDALRQYGGQQKVDVKTHLFLPFEKEILSGASAEGPTPKCWSSAFTAAITEADDVVVLNRHADAATANLCSFTRKCVYGTALARSRSLWTSFHSIDQNGLIEPGSHRTDEGEEMDSLCAFPGVIHHVHRAFLVADMKDYGDLGEEEMLRFSVVMMQRIRDAIRAQRATFAMSKIAGDKLLLVFEDVGAALRAAMAVRDFVRKTPWHGRGPWLRIALHAGPCYSFDDPFQKTRDYCGSHVLQASSLERATPPGEVYASQHFMALCTAKGIEGHRFEYVGKVALARSGETMAAWHVRREGFEKP